MYDSDNIPFHRLSGLLVLVNGLLGEVPVCPVGASEKTELLDEAVRIVREKKPVQSFPRSQATPLGCQLISLPSRRFLTHFHTRLIKDLWNSSDPYHNNLVLLHTIYIELHLPISMFLF